ncbi:ABC transporter ATP-binding protein [uncultured Dysosmobacter sp.]|uniref:ABC transporter ATP-binding protein n=1 Tax=uncultured Dysosmobacter sp. TaxID=2591384 RepID=UPI00262B2C24|nr:ABC transporter ATP-binding protein [uncultured Dysosmobacter sp.]
MLHVQKLSYAYKKIQALTDVSFELRDGEIMSIIGANGAGKSTLMKCIAGVLKTQENAVQLDGRPLARRPHQVVQHGVVLVPEGRWIFPGLSVEENLEIGAYVVGSSKQGKERAFTMFPKLKDRRRQRAGTLSGGEQQMLAIARGLMSDPKIIMLDEPSLGLAPLIVNDIFSIIQQINREGVSVLLVEQNARKALNVADRACVLEQGRIVKQGTGSELASDESIISAYLGGKK